MDTARNNENDVLNRKVLLIDDNHETVCAAGLRLRTAGYQTFAAYDGDAGVASAIENLPDAIVLDVRMPVKDGLTALGELKQRDDTRDIPVVMLSASAVDQPAALRAGARFFLRKPYEGGILVKAVDAVVSGSSTDGD